MEGNIPESAVLLRTLIDHGPQKVPPLTQPLPEPWDSLYRAVHAAGSSSRARRRAFERALADQPDYIRLRLQVEDAYGPPVAVQHAAPKIDQPLKFHPASVALTPRIPQDPLVQDFLLRPSLNLLVGESGAKKTFALLDLAVSVALGGSWLGRKVQPTSVIWIDEENGLDYLLPRLAQVMRAHNAPPELPFHLSSLSGLDLRDPDHLHALKQKAFQADAALIVIDPLIGAIPGADENTVFHLSPIFRSLRHLADRANAALVLVHHTNKTGLYRGSTFLRSAVDLMLMVYSPPHTPFIEFDSVKTRHIPYLNFAAQALFDPPGPAPQRVSLIPAPLAKARYASQLQNALSPAVQHVIDHLSHGPASTADIIKDPLDCTPAQARRAIFFLLQKRLIVRTNPGANGVPAIYALIE